MPNDYATAHMSHLGEKKSGDLKGKITRVANANFTVTDLIDLLI